MLGNVSIFQYFPLHVASLSTRKALARPAKSKRKATVSAGKIKEPDLLRLSKFSADYRQFFADCRLSHC